MVKTTVFCEMTADEMQVTDGGGFWVFVGGAAAGWLICKGLDHTYNAIGRWTGWW